MKFTFSAIIPALLLFSCTLYSQIKTNDYINIPGPLKFENKEYPLSWSSHPTKDYYKQEYIAAGESVDNFSRMIVVEILKGKFKLEEVIQKKINELNLMNKNSVTTQFEVYEKEDEYMLDFLITEKSKDGEEILQAERNLYRYITNKNNLLLLAVVDRARGEKLQEFYENLENNSASIIELVGNYPIPSFTLK